MLNQTHTYNNYSNLTDKELVDIIIYDDNEEAAIYLIYQRYENDIRYHAYRFFNSLDYLDDLTDELYIQIKGLNSDWKPLKSFQWRSSFRTWFNSVTAHLFLTKRKDLIDFKEKTDSINKSTSPQFTVSEDENLKMVMILEAINRLENVDYRFILIKELEGYTPAEIAIMLTSKRRMEGRLKVRVKDNTIIAPTVDYIYMLKQRALIEVKVLVEQIKSESYGNK